QALARPCGQDVAPLARDGRGRVLRDVLLCFRDALLPGTRALRPRRPHTDPARAAAVLVLARLGAPAAASAARRACRRARDQAAARDQRPRRVHRQPLRARRRRRRAASTPVGSERLAQRSGESPARGGGRRADPRRAGTNPRMSGGDPVAVAQQLADELLFPAAVETDRADVLPRELLDALADAGLYGLAAP